jgi:ribosome-binding protein aMBF1 (putative translation factor)
MTPQQVHDGQFECWCCGRRGRSDSVVHLGNHPEVTVCRSCAHFLHQQARGLEDAVRHSPGARVRDGQRALRSLVIRRGWHEKARIGRFLRWLGSHTP